MIDSMSPVEVTGVEEAGDQHQDDLLPLQWHHMSIVGLKSLATQPFVQQRVEDDKTSKICIAVP